MRAACWSMGMALGDILSSFSRHRAAVCFTSAVESLPEREWQTVYTVYIHLHVYSNLHVHVTCTGTCVLEYMYITLTYNYSSCLRDRIPLKVAKFSLKITGCFECMHLPCIILHVHVYTCFVMRDEKEERKKQARSNKQTNKAKQHSTHVHVN